MKTAEQFKKFLRNLDACRRAAAQQGNCYHFTYDKNGMIPGTPTIQKMEIAG